VLQDLVKSILELSATFVTPDWGALVGLIPLGLAALVVLWFALTIRRFVTAGPVRRAPARVAPVAPEGIHMPGPSLAPFLVAFGAAALVWGLVIGGDAQLLGVAILVATLLAWGREALRDYDALAPSEPLPAVVHPGPPPGVHMPGPSIRPFVVAVGTTFMMAGLVIGGWPLLVGAIFVFWALAGWLVDARAEYVKTEEADTTGHLENIPSRRIPTGALTVFAAIFILVALVQAGILPPSTGGTATDGSPAPSAEVLPPGTLAVTAKDIAFDVKALEVEAGKPFSIKFTNADPAGVPHNIDIREADGKTVIETQTNIDGGRSVVYTYKPLQPGTYTFVCQVHPIPAMTGTITVK
jgi:plastocyanin